MAAAETARLIASLELQDKNFTRGLRNVERGVGRVDKKLSAFGGFVNRNLARGIDTFASSLVGGVFAGVESLKELEQQQAQTAAVLKSTGGAAGITADQITNLAEKYEGLNAIMGDEVIRGGENMLLTFTKINKQAFEPALAAILDMNTAMGKGPEGLTSTAIQVGKALNDPTKGLTALSRVGVAFTKDQVKKIKSLQKEGKLYEAQKIILAELNKEFGGSFAAQGDTTAGKVAKFHDAVEDLQRTFAKALLPIIVKVADKLGSFLSDPAVVRGIEKAGEALGSAFDGMLAAAEKINWKAIGNGLRIAADFAGQLVGWFGKMPDWAQALLVGGVVATKLPIVGDIFSEAAKGLIKGVLGINAGIVNVNGPVAGGAPGAAGGAAGGASKFMNAVRVLGAVTIAGASIALLAQTFMDFAEGVGESQKDLLTKVNNTSTQGFKETIANLEATNKGIKNMNPLENVLAGIFGGSEIVKNFEMAASRIGTELKTGQLSREDMVRALAALEETRETNPVAELPETDKQIAALIAAIKNTPAFQGAPGTHRPKPEPKAGAGGAPGAFRPIVKAVSEQRTELNNMSNALATLKGTSAEQKTELSNIKNASATLNTSITTQTSAQTAELANIKNASATLNTTTYAGLLASTAATTAGNLLSVFQSASQVLAANSTTTAANNTTTAARNAGINTANAMTNAANRIVTAVNGLDLSVNVTTVNRTSTVNNRYGPSGGSSTTERAGGNTG